MGVADFNSKSQQSRLSYASFGLSNIRRKTRFFSNHRSFALTLISQMRTPLPRRTVCTDISLPGSVSGQSKPKNI